MLILNIINSILPAITFGLVAGLKTGQLGVFVIHQTMSRGIRYGLFVSMIPLISDIPIIIFVLLAASCLT